MLHFLDVTGIDDDDDDDAKSSIPVITEHQSLWDICVHCMWASLNSTEYTAFPVTTLLQHSAFACGREPVSQTSLYNVKHILM
jgi:hypothetical protein